MRVLKYATVATPATLSRVFDAHYIRLIMGEMYNIESGTLTFIDGQRVAQPERGYPRYRDANGVEYTMRLAAGAIIVPNDVDLESLQFRLVDSFSEFVAAVGEPLSIDPQSIAISYHTNLRAVSALRITNVDGARRENVKRQFTIEHPHKARRCRFHWAIMSAADFCNNSYNTESSLMMRDIGGGIFVDAYHILAAEHNDTLFDFDDSLYRAHVAVKVTDVKLSLHGCPLARMFGPTTKPIIAARSRNLTCAVMRAPFDELTIRRVDPPRHRHRNGRRGAEEEEEPNEHYRCASCRGVMYDDNYVLMCRSDIMAARGYAYAMSRPGIPVCPYCIHVKSSPSQIERRYEHVLRVRFPRSSSDLIRAEPDSFKRQLYVAAMQNGIAIKSISPVELAIGNDWLCVINLPNFLTSPSSKIDRHVAIVDVQPN